MRSQESRVQGENHLPWPADHTSFGCPIRGWETEKPEEAEEQDPGSGSWLCFQCCEFTWCIRSWEYLLHHSAGAEADVGLFISGSDGFTLR